MGRPCWKRGWDTLGKNLKARSDRTHREDERFVTLESAGTRDRCVTDHYVAQGTTRNEPQVGGARDAR